MACNNLMLENQAWRRIKLADEIKFDDKEEKDREGKMQQSDLTPDQVAEI